MVIIRTNSAPRGIRIPGGADYWQHISICIMQAVKVVLI